MPTIGYAGDSDAERNESVLWINIDARSGGVGNVHGWLVSRDAPKQTVDFMKLWLGKDIQTKFCSSLSIPVVEGTVDAIQNPFYKALAVDVNHSDWICACGYPNRRTRQPPDWPLMVRNEFGQLTEAEEKLFRAAAHGRVNAFRIGSRSPQDWLVKPSQGANKRAAELPK